MRSAGEQEEFLEHGRFGETNRNRNLSVRVPKLVIAGLFFLAVGISVLAIVWIFDIGEAEGVLYLYGAALSGLVGLMCCLWSGVSKLLDRRRLFE